LRFPPSHTTVRTGPYTAVRSVTPKALASVRLGCRPWDRRQGYEHSHEPLGVHPYLFVRSTRKGQAVLPKPKSDNVLATPSVRAFTVTSRTVGEHRLFLPFRVSVPFDYPSVGYYALC
jgi:hypothetical protein